MPDYQQYPVTSTKCSYLAVTKYVTIPLFYHTVKKNKFICHIKAKKKKKKEKKKDSS
jgi:hypothetical protein